MDESVWDSEVMVILAMAAIVAFIVHHAFGVQIVQQPGMNYGMR
jgi:hypothetical protein